MAKSSPWVLCPDSACIAENAQPKAACSRSLHRHRAATRRRHPTDTGPDATVAARVRAGAARFTRMFPEAYRSIVVRRCRRRVTATGASRRERMTYVEGFVAAVPEANKEAYKRHAA